MLATDTSSYAARYDMIAVCTGVETLLPKVFTPAERKGAEVRGVNSAMLQQFIDDTLAQAVEGLDRYPLTLVLDRATIHKNVDAIRQAFHDRGSQAIKDILLMPPNAAKRMSPLDNALFHDWKEVCRKRCPVTKRTIQRVMADAWNKLPARLLHSHYKTAASCAARIHTSTAPIPPDTSTAADLALGSSILPLSSTFTAHVHAHCIEPIGSLNHTLLGSFSLHTAGNQSLNK